VARVVAGIPGCGGGIRSGRLDAVHGLVGAGVAGIVAGLAVAVPLGAIGVLLLQEGLLHGRSIAVGGAVGVAAVDLSYAALAVTAGTGVAAALHGRETVVRWVAGAVLAAVALRGLSRLRRPTRSGPEGGQDGVLPAAPDDGPAGPAGAVVRGGVEGRRPAVRSFWRFVGLTAVNPLTAVYFVSLAAGLGDRLGGWGGAALFVLGVGVGSLAWQLVLAVAGATAGRALGGWGRTWTAATGHLLVLALAIALVMPG